MIYKPFTQGSTTALHLAAYVGSLDCVEYLLPLFGDRTFEVDDDGATCLHYAVLGSSLPVMRYLLDHYIFNLSLSAAVSYGMVPDTMLCYLFL